MKVLAYLLTLPFLLFFTVSTGYVVRNLFIHFWPFGAVIISIFLAGAGLYLLEVKE